jgi:hypothetical protein
LTPMVRCSMTALALTQKRLYNILALLDSLKEPFLLKGDKKTWIRKI